MTGSQGSSRHVSDPILADFASNNLGEDKINHLAEIFFAEQDKGVSSYVMARSIFYCERQLDSHDAAWPSFLHALCGVAIIFMTHPDPQEYAKHFDLAEKILHQCDTDQNPTILHIRILFLLVMGLGPLHGPHLVAGRLHRAIYLAHVLNLHLEPDQSLSPEPRKDRLLLYATLAKGDWFSALALDRTFHSVAKSSPSISLLLDRPTNSACLFNVELEPSVQISLQMANLCRRIVERNNLPSMEDSFAVTMELQSEMLAFQGRLQNVSNFGKDNRPKSHGLIQQMMFANMRRALHQPFYHQGWTMATFRASRDISFQSAITNLTCLAQFFADWFPSEDSHQSCSVNNDNNLNNLYASEIVPTMPVTMIWYHIFWSIRCALMIHQHVRLLKDAEEQHAWQQVHQSSSGQEHDKAGLEVIDVKSELLVCQKVLKSTRNVLANLASHSVVAKEGLEALQKTALTKEEVISSFALKNSTNKSDIYGMPFNGKTISPISWFNEGAISQHTSAPDHSALLDEMAIFEDDDGHDFWATLAWLAPTTS